MSNRELKGVVYYGEWDKRKKPPLSDYDTVVLAVFAMLSFIIGGWPL